MFSTIIEIGRFMLDAYEHAWPYLLLTIPLAVLVNVSGISKYIEKTFNAKPLAAIILATFVGAFSPFCSCGVIPIITALLIGGVPLAPVMSFWLASPSMDPEIFFLSVSLLGMDLALWRLAGTFAMSLFGGYITHFLIKIKWVEGDVLRRKRSDKPIFEKKISDIGRRIAGKFKIPALSYGESISSTKAGENCCSEQDSPLMVFRSQNQEAKPSSCSDSSCGKSSCGTDSGTEKITKLKGKVLTEVKKALFMIFKFMTLAFFLEALIILYLPEEWIVNLLGRENTFAIPLSALIGIPLYTTNLSALGLMGGLLKQGMAPGAVLAFLIGGATTTIPAMAAVYGIVKIRVFILYVGFAFGAALLTGYLYRLAHYLF